MSAFKGFIYRTRRGLLTLFFVFISLGLLLFQNQSGVQLFSKMGMSIVYPFQFFYNTIGTNIHDITHAVSKVRQFEKKQKFAQELEQYQKVIVDFNMLINENNNLRNVLDLKSRLFECDRADSRA